MFMYGDYDCCDAIRRETVAALDMLLQETLLIMVM